ncbi:MULTISPECIES: caspase family protein [unclassified Crossiella]|uniref:caspase family protein n=1 Tax=unclassified Crossiella TaxID=2620835 RepID=UPI001FFEBD94|nr:MULTISPECIES: caspase family protein [unclassified Crossiella]MCK2245043.1 caspase family protein [Crossiella sp. S99.2]MCK2258624.1 caspase family protein [Crossiella sp. S99.1]
MRAPDPRLSRAVLIGTSHYAHAEELPPLPAVGDNLADLRRALTDPDTGILEPAQCTVIDTPDSPASLLERLGEAAEQAEDLLLVYYAGHGIRSQVREQLFLGVRLTSPRNLWGTGVPFDSIREVVESSPARTRVLLLDCCYAGLAVRTMAGAGVDIQEVDVRGTAVIASSPRNERSHSPAGERHTAFTGEVIRLLRDGAPVREAPLTVQQLFRSVSAALARRELPRPKGSLGDLSGDLLLRREPGRPSVTGGAVPAGGVTAMPVRPEPVTPEPEPVAPRRPEPAVAKPGPAVVEAALAALAREVPEPVPTMTGPVPYVPPGPPTAEYLRGRPMPRAYYLRVFGSALTTAGLWLLTGYLTALAAGAVLEAFVRSGFTATTVVLPVLAGAAGMVLRNRWRIQVLRGPRWPALAEVRPRLALRLFHTANLLLWAALPPLAVAVLAAAVNTKDLSLGIHFLVAEAFLGAIYLLRRLSKLRW